jgi:hypothetical protein
MGDESFTEQIRQCVRRSGRTNHGLAREMGVAPSVIHRFMHGGGIETATLDKLGRVLKLRVVVDEGKKEG